MVPLADPGEFARLLLWTRARTRREARARSRDCLDLAAAKKKQNKITEYRNIHVDDALTPIADDEREQLDLFQTGEARACVAEQRRLAQIRAQAS